MDATVVPLEVPFRTVFAHAKARRKASSAVLVRLRDDQGRCGFGEGCPRDYVTGERLDSALAWLKRRARAWLAEIDSLEDLKRIIHRDEHEIDRNPSAFCAFEIAMIDLLARRQGVTAETFLGRVTANAAIKVSAVLGSDHPVSHWLQTWRYRYAKIYDTKLKIGSDARRNLARARRLARYARLRLDGNNLWPDAATAIAELRELMDYAWAVEEPLQPRDYAGLVQLHAATGLKVILDESLINMHDFDAFLTCDPSPEAFLINIRISKMGGLIRSLEIIERAHALGFGLILGAQVGETSSLARAGLAVSGAMGPMSGYEGAYGTHLLARDCFTPSLTFDGRGILDPLALSLSGSGFGLSPTAELVSRFDDESLTR